MRIAETLDPVALALITARQRAQQGAWRDAPADGYQVMVHGQSFVVLPDVFPPRSDTELLLANLDVRPGCSVLDVGTGSGVLGTFACQKGALRCIALDISPAAVRNAEINARALGVADRMQIRLSDGLAALADDEMFDLVIANLPGRAVQAHDHVEGTQWDGGFRTHRRFFGDVGRHLAPGGRIVMTKANYPEINDLLAMAERHDFSASVLSTRPPTPDDPRTYYALSFSRNVASG